MAGVAVLLSVLAIEGEVRVTCVIETGVLPARGFVAIVAFIAAAAVVRIIFGVATEAGCRRVGECVIGVAVETGRLLVFADQ